MAEGWNAPACLYQTRTISITIREGGGIGLQGGHATTWRFMGSSKWGDK